MLYGLYLSAAGVMTNSYRQDVIANNLANAQSAGFKKDLTLFKERSTAAQEMMKPDASDPTMEKIGGGTFAMPTLVDTSPGTFESTDNSLDVAIDGSGYLSVDDNGKQRLTRNGKMEIDGQGNLVLANGKGQKVLDTAGNPITLDGAARGSTSISTDGTITQAGKAVGRLGVFDVPDPSKLQKEGGTLFSGFDPAQLQTSSSLIRGSTVEQSNVDPATEMAALMDTQRQLEANANMIRYQDTTLGELVNTVGKVG